MSDCIKVACDFVSLSSVQTCLQLQEQFRAEHREDVLQLHATLWYSWISACRGLDLKPPLDYIESPTLIARSNNNLEVCKNIDRIMKLLPYYST